MKKFSEEQRMIISMRVWDDLSYAVIAEITGKTVDACKQTVSRALKDFQANIAFLSFLFILLV